MLAQAIGYGMLAVWGIVGLSVIGITLYGALRAHLRRWGLPKGGEEGPRPATGQQDAVLSITHPVDPSVVTMRVGDHTTTCFGYPDPDLPILLSPEQLARMEQRAVEAFMYGPRRDFEASVKRPRLSRKAPSHFEPYTLRELLGDRTVDE